MGRSHRSESYIRLDNAMNTSVNHPIFRVDGGCIHGIAMGHVYRGHKLALYLRETMESSVQFIMKGYAKGVAKIREHGFHVDILPKDISPTVDAESTCNLLSAENMLFAGVRHVNSLKRLIGVPGPLAESRLSSTTNLDFLT